MLNSLVTVAALEGELIDPSIITELVNLTKTCIALFGEFPLNIFLTAGLVGIGFGIFKRAKRAAR